MASGPGQDPVSYQKNRDFFDGNVGYADKVGSLDTYRNMRSAIDRAIVGTHHLLDVGNGGVFDYDTSLAREVVGVDLFLGNETPTPVLPANVTLRRGDALALDEPDRAYDRVLHVCVFHHLVGRSVGETRDNIRRAIAESDRVLEADGELLVVESCVTPRAFAVERKLFGMLRLLSRTRLMSHPPTLQLPSEEIAALLAERFAEVAVEPIPVGRYILQFGLRWPTALTPARPFLFRAHR